jgi:hypothetical protein
MASMAKGTRTKLPNGGKWPAISNLWVILAALVGITLLMGWLSSRL